MIADGSSLSQAFWVLLLALTVAGAGYLLFRSRKELHHYRQIFDELPNPLLRVDLQRFEPRACNRAFSQLLGYASNEDCISQFPHQSHLPQHNLHQIYRLYQQSGGKTATLGKIEIRNRHDEVINCTITVRVSADEQAMYLVLDQHRYGLADEPLRRELLHETQSTNELTGSPLYELLDSNIGVWEINWPAGLIYHSEGWIEHLGYGVVAGINQLPIWFSLVSSADRDRVKSTIEGAVGNSPFSLRYRFASQQEIELAIETRGIVVERDSLGKPIILRGIHIDLSNQKDKYLEKKLNHLLMNNLTTILGFSEMIESAEEVPGHIREFATRIYTSGEKIRNQIQPVETISSAIPVDRLAEEHGLKFNGGTALPTGISSNVLAKAIEGVIEFMDSEGTSASERNITTMLRNEEQCSACSDNLDECYFAVTITDTGLHFDRDHFKHFLTTESTIASFGTTTKLLEVSNFVHRCGGHIRLTMGNTGFSTVLLFSVEQQARPVVVKRDGHDNNILIIDDEPAVANFLEEIIQQAGYSAIVFTNPGDALDRFKENPEQFDLVITDHSMPGFSGAVVMQAMLEQRPELPIIMCTGFSEEMDANTALELGAAGYVTKPIDVPHLVQLVGQSLKGIVK